jgi:predicted transport protein
MDNINQPWEVITVKIVTTHVNYVKKTNLIVVNAKITQVKFIIFMNFNAVKLVQVGSLVIK